MPHALRLPSAIALLVALAVAALATPAAGQTPEVAPFTIELDVSADQAGHFPALTARVGADDCGRIDLAAGERTLVVGAAGTPEACRDAGRTVDLVPDGHSLLQQQPALVPGLTLTLTALNPRPTTLGGPAFTVELPNVAGPSDLDLTAYVDGVACGSLVWEVDTAYVPVGSHAADNTPLDPAPCYQDLAVVTLVDEAGRAAFVRPTLHLGDYYTLEDMTLAAAPEGGAGPAPAAAGQQPLPAIEVVDLLLPILLLGMVALGLTSVARRVTGR
ncbi:MAG: hypothetical protein WD058_06290 [Dehalococcoidia bacterium]